MMPTNIFTTNSQAFLQMRVLKKKMHCCIGICHPSGAQEVVLKVYLQTDIGRSEFDIEVGIQELIPEGDPRFVKALGWLDFEAAKRPVVIDGHVVKNYACVIYRYYQRGTLLDLIMT